MAYTTDINTQVNRFGSSTVREDLADRITIMTPRDAPLFAELAQIPTHDTEANWIVDRITRPTTVSVSKEGEDAVFTAPEYRPRLGNYCGITKKTWDVTGTQRAVMEAGVVDEYVHRAWKETQAMILQAEYNHTWGQSAAGNVSGDPSSTAASTARQMHGIMSWLIWTGLARLAGSNQTVSIGGRSFDCTLYGSTITKGSAALTKSALNTIFQNAWAQGFTVGGCKGFMGAAIKQTISEFANVYEGGTDLYSNDRGISADARAVVDTVDIYANDFGAIGMNLSRYLNGGTGENKTMNPYASGNETVTPNKSFIFLEPDKAHIGVLRGLEVDPLAKIGDSSKGQTLMETTIRVDNPIALCGGYNYG